MPERGDGSRSPEPGRAGALQRAQARTLAAPAVGGMSYTLRLLTGNGVSSGIVFADALEIGRIEPASRESAIEQAQEIAHSHAEGWRTVESVELG